MFHPEDTVELAAGERALERAAGDDLLIQADRVGLVEDGGVPDESEQFAALAVLRGLGEDLALAQLEVLDRDGADLALAALRHARLAHRDRVRQLRFRGASLLGFVRLCALNVIGDWPHLDGLAEHDLAVLVIFEAAGEFLVAGEEDNSPPFVFGAIPVLHPHRPAFVLTLVDVGDRAFDCLEDIVGGIALLGVDPGGALLSERAVGVRRAAGDEPPQSLSVLARAMTFARSASRFVPYALRIESFRPASSAVNVERGFHVAASLELTVVARRR